MTEPLWTDERINDAVIDMDFPLRFHNQLVATPLIAMRNEYEAERIQLKALLSTLAAERTNEIAELEAIKVSIDAKAQLEAQNRQPLTDAAIDTLIIAAAGYMVSMPVAPPRDEAFAALRGIVREWLRNNGASEEA